jgi:hypothetical protein
MHNYRGSTEVPQLDMLPVPLTEAEYLQQAEADLVELGQWPTDPNLQERLRAWHRGQYREWKQHQEASRG